MNSRIENGHFTAGESRELLYLINDIEELKTSLTKTELNFNIDDYYKSVLRKCKDFLQSAGGSTIPDGFSKINIQKFSPIFILTNEIKLRK